MKSFDVELTESKTHLYTGIAANSPEEAITIAEDMKSEDEEGEVIAIEQLEADAYPSEEIL